MLRCCVVTVLSLVISVSLMGCGAATPTPEPGAHVPGQAIEDFTLPMAGRGQVTLSKQLAEGPVVLVFYRGSWCVSCKEQLGALNEYIDEFELRGASLIAVSADDASTTEALVLSQHLNYPVLSDEDLAVIKAYGVQHEDADHAFPATFILLPDGTVVYREVAQDNEGGHPDVSEILEALDASKDK